MLGGITMAKKEPQYFTTPVDITDNAYTVLKKRYLKKDDNGNPIEEPKDMFKRVAMNIAQADLNYDKTIDVDSKVADTFYQQMASLKFLPNSPTLMNAGRELQQLSACFVLPVEDSLDSIFESIKNTALIHKSGGGTGFSFTRLRPKDDTVMTTKGVSSGPVSFMTVFDAATETIKQGGTRRGANMGILRVDHPDIMDFIYAKKDKSKLTNFNLSVAITEKFMEAVKHNEMYDLINPKTKKVVKQLNAKMVFDEMVQLAWEGGDPGIVFIDRINDANPTPAEGEMEATNPCGEQPLLPYESCNLGSINLGKFVIDGKIDWDGLANTVSIAVHFLDNVIDMNKYPLEAIDKQTKRNRKIGLGIMGWADMLSMLCIPYDSDRAIALAEEVMRIIQEMGRTASCQLAASKRGSFPSFDESIYNMQSEIANKKWSSTHLRNATITTIAPTGTISMIANASGGIEPHFAIAYFKRVMDNDKLVEVNPIFVKIAKEEGFYSDELMQEIAETGNVHNNAKVPEKWQRAFVTSHEISPEWHIKMQAAFQKYTDNAVSKTINFSNDATIEDVANAYMLAYDLKCKGTTIYRDGSRDLQVLNVGTKTEEKKEEPVEINTTVTHQVRPKVLHGTTIETMTGCGKLYVTFNVDSETGKPFEVFISMGKAGGCAQSQCEAIGRLISMNLRSNGDITRVIKQLKGISCHMKYGFGPNTILSCSDAVAKALTSALEVQIIAPTVTDTSDGTTVTKPEPVKTMGGGACPDCGGPISHEEGCDKCYSCGYSHCS
jgi:ribonucleoside-diphosphate reductase alpha chain